MIIIIFILIITFITIGYIKYLKYKNRIAYLGMINDTSFSVEKF